ncbi:MAG: hypothetical protein Q9203_006857, partial [Teloschistes exilis]
MERMDAQAIPGAGDLGIRTRRKKNAVLEMFQPYRPSDYRGLIEEYLAANLRPVLTE